MPQQLIQRTTENPLTGGIHTWFELVDVLDETTGRRCYCAHALLNHDFKYDFRPCAIFGCPCVGFGYERRLSMFQRVLCWLGINHKWLAWHASHLRPGKQVKVCDYCLRHRYRQGVIRN